MNITKNTIVGIFGGATLVTAAITGVAATASADSAPKAKVTVTIKAEGVELSGVVKSKKASCAANRKVKVFQVINGEAKQMFSDTTDRGSRAVRLEHRQHRHRGPVLREGQRQARLQGRREPDHRRRSPPEQPVTDAGHHVYSY